MKIPPTVKHAVLIMLILADSEDNGNTKLSAIARQLGISKDYLNITIRFLCTAGLVSGKIGPGGGYILNFPPDKITLADICVAVLGKIDLCPCLIEPEDCESILVCKNIQAWAKVSSAIHSKLEQIRLSDLSGSICPPGKNKMDISLGITVQ